MMPNFNFFDFSEDCNIGTMLEALENNHVSNCADIDSTAEVLADDYYVQRFNILPLISEGVNLRYLMELRKTLILSIFPDDYYINALKLKTVEELKEYRTNYIRKYLPRYTDEDYWYYWVYKTSLYHWQQVEMQIDFEYLYQDCDPSHEISSEDDNKLGIFLIHFNELPKDADGKPITKPPKTTEDLIEECIRDHPVIMYTDPADIDELLRQRAREYQERNKSKK